MIILGKPQLKHVQDEQYTLHPLKSAPTSIFLPNTTNLIIIIVASLRFKATQLPYRMLSKSYFLLQHC